MAAMYDGDNNRVFQIDNTYKWEDCYGDDVLIPKSERTENGDSPKEELASLVKGGANAKGYTLTEYVNDVNRENTEVLSEYKADNTVRQAYTYGESGNGERIGVDKVDKSTETSYYMYDGRGSVTGLVTDNGTLTNSYTYDPYGTLTSGTADAVNYYGYNAESTNTKTGLQYLRARYYDPENGNFTSEDTEDGELPFPLTRNRYVYALNNPLNYKDPTGHKSKAVGKAVSGAVGGVMGTIFDSTKTVKKVDEPVKHVASAPRRSMQRETGNASGAASGHSKGGNAQASDSAGNKAGSMAAGNTGKLAGMSGVTGNQRSSYKEQMAKVRLEQSRRVTCSAGQKNASAGTTTVGMTLPMAYPWLWELLCLVAEVTAELAFSIGITLQLTDALTSLFGEEELEKKGRSETEKQALSELLGKKRDQEVATGGGGTPSPEQDPNNKGNVELAKLAKAATQGAALGNAIGMANNAIRETADTIKDTVDTVSSYVNRGPNNPLLGDWGDGNRGSAYDNALHHYDKHGTEVGAKDFDDYLRKANAFKNTVTNAGSRITPTPVDGATPDVYRYRYNGKYIDLQYIREQDMVSKLFGLLDGNEGRVVGYKIISYGAE